MAIEEHQERLAYLAFNMLFPDDVSGDPDTDEQDPRYQALRDRLNELWPTLPAATTNVLDDVRKDISNPLGNPVHLQNRLLSVLADTLLGDLATAAGIDPLPTITDQNRHLREAAARTAIEHQSDGDKRLIGRWVQMYGGPGIAPGEPTPPYNGGYDIDRNNLPSSVDAAVLKALRRAIRQRATDRGLDIDNAVDAAHIAYITGSLLLQSFFSATSPGFDSAFSDEYNKGFEVVDMLGNRRAIARDLYPRVAGEIAGIKGAQPTVQEVTAVTDDVLELGPVNDNFRAKVSSAHTDFVARTPLYDSLELPDIVTDDTAQAEVEPANIRAVGMIYAAGHLEMLFGACDAAAQDWHDGFIPVGASAGQLFDAYVWNTSDRLSANAREIQSDRIADVHDHLMRFCSATSERDRARYLSEYLVGDNRRRTAQPRDAAVRKAARDLLAYASLHGWAYAQFAARRLGNHIRECTQIAENAEVQKAYGVQGPWQFVERVHQMNGGDIPNIAKDRTLASTGKEILDLLASKSKDIAASLAKDPLFPTDTVDGGRSIFTNEEYEQLLVHVENWLAANGINDSERAAASQLVDAGAAPSLPTFGGAGLSGNGGFDATGARDQLMQIVASGQMPSVGQIDQLFKVGV